MDIRLTPEERLEVFGSFDPQEHAAEAQQRWADTEAYRESTRRANGYAKDDWARIGFEARAIDEQFVGALEAGTLADADEAMDLAEAHREHISRWFYPCSRETHLGLAEMYVDDERFSARFERLAADLARYVHDAIVANARRQAR